MNLKYSKSQYKRDILFKSGKNNVFQLSNLNTRISIMLIFEIREKLCRMIKKKV